MSYNQVLNLMARLHDQETERQAYEQNPVAYLAGLDLTDEERTGLLQLSEGVLSRIRLTSGWHRLARLQDYLPWVEPALRPTLAPLVKQFGDQIQVSMFSREEALRFCEWLQTQDVTPPWLTGLARLEWLRISIAWGLNDVGTRAELTVDDAAWQLYQQPQQEGWPTASHPVTVRIQKVPVLPASLVSLLPHTAS